MLNFDKCKRNNYLRFAVATLLVVLTYEVCFHWVAPFLFHPEHYFGFSEFSFFSFLGAFSLAIFFGFMFFLENVSKKKKMELGLEDNEKLLRTQGTLLSNVLAHIPHFVFWKDRQSVYLGCNHVFSKAAGLKDPSEIVGKTDYQLAWKKEEADYYRKVDEEVMSKNIPFSNFEETQLQADGTETVILTSKVPLKNPTGEVVGILGIYSDITTRKKRENDLTLFRTLLDHSNDSLFIIESHTGKFLDVNGRVCESLRYDKEELLQMDIGDIDKGLRNLAHWQELCQEILNKGGALMESHHTSKDGKIFDMEINYKAISYQHNDYIVGIARDIAEKKTLEEQLRQSQKMEAIGRLAGGIAHDFNNLLTIINGNSEIVIEEIEKSSPHKSDLEEILQAGKKASLLTRQLLSFSRRQTIHPRNVDINELLSSLTVILKRLIGENIDLQFRPTTEETMVRGDRTQMEQIFINLAVNSRDALPNGGNIVIETKIESAKENPDEATPSSPRLLISFTDDGVGMNEETTAKLFEPFFTTKEKGQGTGLGLATCYGIIQQFGGTISVKSELNKGTTVLISLPTVEQSPPSKSPKQTPVLVSRGLTGSILLVEDEPLVKRLVKKILDKNGFSVWEAENGLDAINKYRETDINNIGLLITDVVMPKVGGKQLVQQFRKTNPNMKVIYMSGYTNRIIDDKDLASPNTDFLHKPFTPDELLEKINTVI